MALTCLAELDSSEVSENLSKSKVKRRMPVVSTPRGNGKLVTSTFCQSINMQSVLCVFLFIDILYKVGCIGLRAYTTINHARSKLIWYTYLHCLLVLS